MPVQWVKDVVSAEELGPTLPHSLGTWHSDAVAPGDAGTEAKPDMTQEQNCSCSQPCA